MKEIWKDIEGYCNYQISNKGNIRNIKTNKFRKPYHNIKNHYAQIAITNDLGERKLLFVHRLVAKAFIPNPNNLPQVNHIIPVCKELCDNSVENLEWSNQSHNMKHKAMCGNYHNQILSYEDVLEIRELYATGNYTQRELAKMYSYTQPNIHKIVHHKIW